MKNQLPFTSLIILIILAFSSGCDLIEEDFSGSLIDNLLWREIGPGTYGGRISDIEVDPSDHNTIFVSPSTGGIFKTTDNGLTWRAVFDKAGTTLSIGDIAISESNPDIMWAGSGEASGEQSPSSIGDGIYKSTDGGESWENMGLKESRHFSKVVIHPENPDILFAGATGSRWGENDERGVFRTKDGGESWEKVLFINGNTGISDVVMHPGGKRIFASAWEQRRSAWAHVRMGPGSGLYRSDNGGDSWTKVTDGLPQDNIGRIALAIAPSNPDVMYACLEHDSLGLFRSDDGGSSWKNMYDRVRTSYWYGRIYVDPNDENRIWVMGVNVMESTDGGKTFNRVVMRGVHVDHHVVWFNPEDKNHIILGNDGGLYFTNDRGGSWDFVANIPIGQYYDISIDNRDPYWVYGGLQDNGVRGGPSGSATGRPVTNSDIVFVSGGDGFYSATEPADPFLV